MANLSENRISYQMSEIEVQAVLQAITSIGDSLQFLITATAAQRQTLPKMNVDNTVFVADAINVGKQNATVLGNTIAGIVPEIEKDYNLFHQLERVELALAGLLKRVRDTRLIAGSEAYTNSLMIYKMIKAFALAGFPDAEIAYNLLKQRFEGQGNFNEGEETTEIEE